MLANTLTKTVHRAETCLLAQLTSILILSGALGSPKPQDVGREWNLIGTSRDFGVAKKVDHLLRQQAHDVIGRCGRNDAKQMDDVPGEGGRRSLRFVRGRSLPIQLTHSLLHIEAATLCALQRRFRTGKLARTVRIIVEVVRRVSSLGRIQGRILEWCRRDPSLRCNSMMHRFGTSLRR